MGRVKEQILIKEEQEQIKEATKGLIDFEDLQGMEHMQIALINEKVYTIYPNEIEKINENIIKFKKTYPNRLEQNSEIVQLKTIRVDAIVSITVCYKVKNNI